MIEKCRHWKEAHPDLWEFILFNLLSNCATVTNFLVLWLTTGVLFAGLTQPFRWLFFDYTAEGSGGLGGFLGFLTAYTCAQIVNYIVQRKLVFGATVEISKTIGWYILTVVVAGVISVALPGYITPVLSTYWWDGRHRRQHHQYHPPSAHQLSHDEVCHHEERALRQKKSRCCCSGSFYFRRSRYAERIKMPPIMSRIRATAALKIISQISQEAGA